MKIGIVADYYLKSGGGENFVNSELEKIEILKKDLKDQVSFDYIVTNKNAFNELNKKFDNVIHFDKENLINRTSLFLNSIDSIRKLIFKLNINSFENFLKKKNISLLIFLTPSKLVYFCRRIDFISTIWELEYKTHPHLPEYKNIHFDLKERDNISKFISLYSYATFVGTKKSGDDFSKFYSCDLSRIIQKYTQSAIVNKAKNLEMPKTTSKKFEYIFYPAQFWSHKNHKFIVNAFEEIKKNNIDLKCVFTGSDKGYLKKIKKLIEKKELNDFFIFYDYLSDEEIINLYLNCNAVIVPSIVGTYAFPHIEAFYFEKVVFGSVENLDMEFKKRVIEIDLNHPENFLKKYLENFNQKENIDNMIKQNKEFYDKNFSNQVNTKIYKSIIEKYLSKTI